MILPEWYVFTSIHNLFRPVFSSFICLTTTYLLDNPNNEIGSTPLFLNLSYPYSLSHTLSSFVPRAWLKIFTLANRTATPW